MSPSHQGYSNALQGEAIEVTEDLPRSTASSSPVSRAHEPRTNPADDGDDDAAISTAAPNPPGREAASESRDTFTDIFPFDWRSSLPHQGLGVSLASTLSAPQSVVHRDTTTRRGLKSPHTPASADPLIPSPLNPSYQGSPMHHGDDDEAADEPEQGQHERRHSRRTGSLAGSRSKSDDTDEEDLVGDDDGRGWPPRSTSQRAPPGCPSRRDIVRRRYSWDSVTILVLSVFSTVFSGIYFVVAAVAPSYGGRIRSSSGGMSPATATFLTALFAKLIELSFVTVFASFLGQVLSRRAFVKGSGGMTLAQLTMREWILQPGTLLTHVESVRYAALTFLGAVALTAAVLSSLYTSASDGLVAPKLRWDRPEPRDLYGLVATKYANPEYAASKCATPIRSQPGGDPNPQNDNRDASGTSCLQIQHAGQSFRNFALYLDEWSDIAAAGHGPTTLGARPRAPGMWENNTLIRGSWIEVRSFNETSAAFGRRVHNVSLAMPHAGVVAAAQDPINSILQPKDLAGIGRYRVGASVPSPAVNVLCVGMTKPELEPLVYDMWDHGNTSYLAAEGWRNRSVVDDIFGFGQGYSRYLPTFQKAPIDHNTLLNLTTSYADGSIYVLAKAPAFPSPPALSHPYELCSLRSFLSPSCSTWYNASANGASLHTRCEDPRDFLAYKRFHRDAPPGEIQNDWRNIASEWASSLSLGAGISDSNASSARILTRFIPRSAAGGAYELDSTLPSSAEALAVLAGSTLLLSSRDAPYVHGWNYSNELSVLPEPQYQSFHATLQSEQFASGPSQNWQKVFFLVLALVFATNLFCLIYLVVRRGQVTDFTEPQNLFALSINSPPSQRLAGSCGGGPEPSQYKVNWFIHVDRDDHVYIQNAEDGGKGDPSSQARGARRRFGRPQRRRRSSRPTSPVQMDSPLMKSYTELSRQQHNLL